MGWFGKGNAGDAAKDLDQGRRLLWARDAAQAVRVFDRLTGDRTLEPVALAWRSLAHRMAGRTDKALADAAKAAKLAPHALEPQAAMVAARLTDRDVVASVAAFSNLKSAQAHDVEGHFLHLLCFALLHDCIASMTEDADGLQLDFRLTPSAEGAVLIFDGQLDRAIQRLTFNVDESWAFELARGLAYYRAAMWSDALKALEPSAAKIARDNFNVGPALAAVIATARAAA